MRKLGKDPDSDGMDEEIDLMMAAQQGDSNKFDMLCDGVLNSLALVQTTLSEFLALKDELLVHALPPTLMARLAMVAGRVFRSTTDLQTPVNELVRLVRVYSVSWEEKSAALKKLHTDYESKHKQLNIAIRRLQLLDAQAKRMAREKRIMMWEKLFSKVTSCRGHGRRWKFLIDNFKQKAKLGMEHLQAYIESLDREPDSDEEGKDEMKSPEPRSQSSVNELQLLSSSDELDFTEEESDSDDEKADGQESTARATAQTQRDDLDSDIVTPASKRVTFQDARRGGGDGMLQPEVIPETVIVEVPAPKPPSADKCMWTHEPQYDWFLNVKMYHPVGIQGPDIKCSVNFKKEFLKTEFYSRPVSREKSSKPPSRSQQLRSGRGRSMIGSKAPDNNTPPKSVTLRVPGESSPDDRWQTLVFSLGDKPLFEIEDPLTKKEKTEEEKEEEAKKKDDVKPPEEVREPTDGEGDENQDRVQSAHSTATSTATSTDADIPVKLGVHQGHLDELVALGNVDLADLREEEIQIFDSVDDTVDVIPHSYPIYPIKASRKLKTSPDVPCGSLPLVFFYTRVLKPFTFEKEAETASINDIVLDLTGVDLTKVRKEDLSINKQYEERCLSALSLRSSTTSDKPEMIPRAELDIVLEQHNQELTILTEEFEERIRELAQALEAVQTEQLNMISGIPPSHRGSIPKAGLRGWTPGRDSVIAIPQPPDGNRLSNKKKSKKLSAKLPDWGSDLPKDFLDRLQFFREESERKRLELYEKTRQEVSNHLERQLAGQYRLNLHNDDSEDATKEISLPAVFMPTKTGQLFNPRAHQYFHPSGSLGHLRLTQPPSIFQLPPLPTKNRMSVINLFDIRKSMNWAAAQEWANRVPNNPTELLANTPNPDSPMYEDMEPPPNTAADNPVQ